MEGTRHERAIVMIATYVLGFTAAFILFNDNQVTSNLISPRQQTANMSGVMASQIDTQEQTSLTYIDGRLELNLPSGKKVLSVNPDLNVTSIDFASVEQGYHYGDLKYNLSPDSRFVFLCERQFPEESACLGFIYDISSDIFHQVRKESDLVSISLKSASNVNWSNEGLINIGSTRSKSANEPWILVEAN